MVNGSSKEMMSKSVPYKIWFRLYPDPTPGKTMEKWEEIPNKLK